MNPQDELSVPFVTRKMLNFEHGLTFSLKIVSQSNTATTLTIRGMTREGLFSLRHTTLGTGATATDTYRIPDMPVFLSVSDEAGALKQGDCYITIGLLAGTDRLFELGAGFVYSQKSVSFPATNASDIHPGKGRIRTIVGTAPANGAPATATVPAGRIWHLLSVSHEPVADGTGATRRPLIEVDDGASGVVLSVFANATAGVSFDGAIHYLQQGSISTVTVADKINGILPSEVFMPEGFTISATWDGITSGDDLNNIQLLIEEFIEVPI